MHNSAAKISTFNNQRAEQTLYQEEVKEEDEMPLRLERSTSNTIQHREYGSKLNQFFKGEVYSPMKRNFNHQNPGV